MLVHLRRSRAGFICAFGLAVTISQTVPSASAREIASGARVNEDASLRIGGETVHLYGIHVPSTGRTCSNNRVPPVCGSRAALALDFKIHGFVRCEILQRNPDHSIVGRCRINASRLDDGEDLSAYLLERGWALALPDAPFEFHALEKIARNQGIGVWGIPADTIRFAQ